MNLDTKELQKLTKKYEFVWDSLTDSDVKEMMDFSEGYKKFMDASKTEREACNEIVRIAKENGFVDLNEVIKNGGKLNNGDKVYAVNKQKSVALFVIGEEKLKVDLI